MKHALLIFAVGILEACSDRRSLILKLSPLNGATSVATSIQPVVEFSGAAQVDATARKLVLMDITNNGSKVIAGDIDVHGSVMTYIPTVQLPPNRQYGLSLKEEAVSGEDYDEVDASEDPIQAITWPFVLRFRTMSCPRIREAFIEKPSGRIWIKFSQQMDMVSTGKAIQLQDGATRLPITLGTPVWPDSFNVYVSPNKSLINNTVYILKVGQKAMAYDNIGLDGDDDGKPGEKTDDFCVKFTGSQQVIFSRLKKKNTSTCN